MGRGQGTIMASGQSLLFGPRLVRAAGGGEQTGGQVSGLHPDETFARREKVLAAQIRFTQADYDLFRLWNPKTPSVRIFSHPDVQAALDHIRAELSQHDTATLSLKSPVDPGEKMPGPLLGLIENTLSAQRGQLPDKSWEAAEALLNRIELAMAANVDSAPSASMRLSGKRETFGKYVILNQADLTTLLQSLDGYVKTGTEAFQHEAEALLADVKRYAGSTKRPHLYLARTGQVQNVEGGTGADGKALMWSQELSFRDFEAYGDMLEYAANANARDLYTRVFA